MWRHVATVLALVLVAVSSPLAQSRDASLRPTATPAAQMDIAYAKDSPMQTLDLYLPSRDDLSNVALSAADIEAVVGLSTPVDLAPQPKGLGFGDTLLSGPGADVFRRNVAIMREASPIEHVSTRLPPTLLLVGERDFPMLADDAQAFAAKMSAIGRDVTVATIAAKDHGAMARGMADEADPVFQQVLHFLRGSGATSRLAADASGTWSGTLAESDAPTQGTPLYIVLKQEGTTLTGTAGPGKVQQWPIQNGKIDGDHLTFTVQMGGGDNIVFDLKVDGDDLHGDMVLSEGANRATAKAVLKRVKT